MRKYFYDFALIVFAGGILAGFLLCGAFFNASVTRGIFLFLLFILIAGIIWYRKHCRYLRSIADSQAMPAERDTQAQALNSQLQTANQQLKESEYRYRTLAATVPEMIYVVDGQGTVSYLNPEAARQFDVIPEKIIGRNIVDLFTPELASRHLKAIREVMGKGCKIHQELEEEFPNRKIWIEATLAPLRNSEGKTIAALGISRDITERRQAEDRIRTSLKEKEVLLREIHHRVKNNLQVISSLFSLQSALIVDKRDAAVFTACQERVRTMALAHDKLYKSADLSHIDFREYTTSLVSGLVQVSRRPDIHLKVISEKVFLTIDKTIPCGLIVNELVSNSLQHGFPEKFAADNAPNQVTIRFGEYSASQWVLTVSDNGVGLTATLDDIRPRKLGLELVKILTRQLNGQITASSDAGTIISITFPKG